MGWRRSTRLQKNSLAVPVLSVMENGFESVTGNGINDENQSTRLMSISAGEFAGRGDEFVLD